MGMSFAEVIKIGEMVEYGFKMGWIMSHDAFKATSQDVQNGSGGLMNRYKREERAMMVSNSRGPVCHSTNHICFLRSRNTIITIKMLLMSWHRLPMRWRMRNLTCDHNIIYKIELHLPEMLVPTKLHIIPTKWSPIKSLPKRVSQKESIHPYWWIILELVSKASQARSAAAHGSKSAKPRVPLTPG